MLLFKLKYLSGFSVIVIFCLYVMSASGQLKKTVQSDSNFAKHWKFIGIAIQDPGFNVWGASPVMDEGGKVHLFANRFKIGSDWRTMEIAHYVADGPEGPFRFSNVAMRGTGKDTWDKFAATNPTIHKVGDEYVLIYVASGDHYFHDPPGTSNQSIGMATSKSLNGPWKKVSGNGRILTPPDAPGYWNYQSGCGVNNPAFLSYKGGYYLYFKTKNTHNKVMYGLAIAEHLTGPYVQMPFSPINNKLIIEDGYAFMYQGKVSLLTTDNEGIFEYGGGILWQSSDGGITFDHSESGFTLLGKYVDTTKVKPHWGWHSRKPEMKFERPQILMQNGKPAYLYAASSCNISGGKGTVNYVLKFIP